MASSNLIRFAEGDAAWGACDRSAASLLALPISAAGQGIHAKSLPPTLSISGVAQAKNRAFGIYLFLVGSYEAAPAANGFSNPKAHRHDFFPRAQYWDLGRIR